MTLLPRYLRKKSLAPVLTALISVFTPFLHFQALAEEQVSVELEQVDIRDFIRWAARLTEETIVLHPQVSGSVTVISGKEITKNEAFEIFLATLQVYGFSVIRSDDVLKVIPSEQATSGEIPLLGDKASQNAEDIVVKILTVENVAATEVVNLLKPIASKYAYITAYAATNALIIADRSSKVAQLEKVIAKIDRAGEVEVDVMELTYANAEEVARVITQLLPQNNAQNQSDPKFKLTVDTRTNSIMITGDAMTKSQIRSLINNMDKPVVGSGNTSVIKLQYAEAAQIVPILETVSGSIKQREKDQRLADVDVKISAHEPLNAIVITAAPSMMETMRAVIAELDSRRSQVLVEAIIVEVSEDLAKDLGVEWQTNLETDDAVYASGSLLPSVLADGINFSDGVVSAGSGLSLGYFRRGSLRAVIRALEGNSKANILSTPSIVALDNEQASILVGSNVPFITGSLQRPGDENPFQTIQRQDIGITLEIKPRINNSNSLTLEIAQKVESLGQSDARTADIITNKRELSTRVLIENDDVLVLGGLIQDEVRETETKVPILGDIPLLGRAFRGTSSSLVKSNLMVFIHPVILPDRQTGLNISRNNYNRIRDQQRSFKDKVDRFILSSELPELAPYPDMRSSSKQETESP